MSRWRSLLTRLRYAPELPTMFYLFGLMFYGPIIEQYVYKAYSNELGYNYTINGGSSSGNCPTDEPANSTNRLLQKEVQAKVSQFMPRYLFCSLIPSMILCLFFGPLTDWIGRKPVIIFGLFCNLMAGTLILFVQILDMNVKLFYLANFMIGVGGSYVSVTMAVSAYLCDITEGKNRALRIAFIDLLLFLAVTLSSYASGAFLEKFGFRSSFIFVLVLASISFLEAVFLLRESLPKDKRIKPSSCYMLPMNVLRIVIKSRLHTWKLILFLIISSLVVFISPSAILSPLMLYLINIPFCWTPKAIGFYRGTYFLVLGVGCVIGVKLLPKIASTALIIMISTFSAAGYLVAIAYSQTQLMNYLVIFVGLFAFVAPAIMRGGMSQIVTEHEQGALFAFIGSLHALFQFLASMMYQKLYIYFNDRNHPGSTFLFGGCTCILPLIFIVIFAIKDHHSTRNDSNIVHRINQNVEDVESVTDEQEPLISS